MGVVRVGCGWVRGSGRGRGVAVKCGRLEGSKPLGLRVVVLKELNH